MDLYRLGGDFDLGVLGIPRVLETSVCLIEWPDRLGATQPDNRLGENVSICQFAIGMICPMTGNQVEPNMSRRVISSDRLALAPACNPELEDRDAANQV